MPIPRPLLPVVALLAVLSGHAATPAPPAEPSPAPAVLRNAAVLKWLEEDAQLADQSDLPDLAAARRADLAALQSQPPAETPVAPHPDLLPPLAHPEGNPVLAEFVQKLDRAILTPDKRFPKGAEGGRARTEEGWAYGVRADELLRLAQAFCHPQSPRRDDPALIAPILRRLAFFAEYMAAGGPVLGDFGPCGNIADACLILTTCRPEIIPPGLRRDIDQAIRNNADAILAKCPAWAAPLPTSECLVNADVNYVLAVAIANRMFPSPAYAAGVKNGLDYIEPHILPDGATNYVGRQNECPGYHGQAIFSLARTAQITGDPRPLDMVKRLRWYYPLVVSPTGVMEWATATSWHHYWNTDNGARGAAILAELTDCPHNQRVANLGYNGDLWAASWWNPERIPAPCPDTYFTYDRNVQGPRARFGPWSLVGTTRKTEDKRGKSSYVGCVLETGEPGKWQLDAALQDAGMEIRLDPSRDDASEHRGRITLAHDEPITTSAVGQHAAALGAVARLGSYGKPATDWITRQAWLFTPERLVGLVTLEAGTEMEAAGIFGDLFLVSGRANWGQRKELRDLGDGRFAYGALVITFHAHDFLGFTHEYTDVMGGGLNQSSSRKSCRLLLVDEAAKTGAITTYPAGTKHFYLVEVRPASSPAATVRKVDAGNGLLAFLVGEGKTTYQVAFNPGEKPVRVPFRPPGTLHRSGEAFRPEWLQAAGPVPSVAPIPCPNGFDLPPGEIAFVRSP